MHLHKKKFFFLFFLETTLFPFVCDLLLRVMYRTFKNNSFVSLCNWRTVICQKIISFYYLKLSWALHSNENNIVVRMTLVYICGEQKNGRHLIRFEMINHFLVERVLWAEMFSLFGFLDIKLYFYVTSSQKYIYEPETKIKTWYKHW